MKGQEVWILYSGYGNIGDEAITWGTLRLFKNLGYIKKVRLIDSYPKVPSKFGLSWPDVDYVNIETIMGSRILRTLKYAFTLPRVIFPRIHQKSEPGEMLWHRGCSGYDSYHGTRLLLESIVYSSAIALNFSCRVLGGLSTGYTSSELDRNILKKFLAIWDWILLREPLSFYYIRDLISSRNKVLLVHDFSVHVDGFETDRSRRIKEILRHIGNGENLVGLILRDYYYQRYYPDLYRIKYLHFIKKLVNALTKHGLKTILIPFGYLGNHENDIKFYRELKALRIVKNDIPILDEVINLTPSEVIDVLSLFNYIISARTHGFILATLAGVPALHLYYEHKGRGILKHTFDTEAWSLTSCLNKGDDVEKITKYLIEDADKKSVRGRILKVRRYNEKIVHTIFGQTY